MTSSVSRSFSIDLDTSLLINRIRDAERKRPFSHVVRDAMDEYAKKNHPQLFADKHRDREIRE